MRIKARHWLAFIALALVGCCIAPCANSAPICDATIPHSTISPEMASSVCEEVKRYAKAYGVRESLAVAVAEHESNFRPWAVSHAGAIGPMQIKPHYHCPAFLGIRWCKSRSEFAEAGIRHLAELLSRKSEHDALRCYNAGISACRNEEIAEGYAAAVARIERRLQRRGER